MAAICYLLKIMCHRYICIHAILFCDVTFAFAAMSDIQNINYSRCVYRWYQ